MSYLYFMSISFYTPSSTKSVNYTIDSEELFKIVARNNGVNLTEIVRTSNPKFDFLNTPKTAYRHALDVLVNQGRIRFTMKGKRRDLYFLDCEYRETSKRVIFKKFVEDMLATL